MPAVGVRQERERWRAVARLGTSKLLRVEAFGGLDRSEVGVEAVQGRVPEASEALDPVGRLAQTFVITTGPDAAGLPRPPTYGRSTATRSITSSDGPLREPLGHRRADRAGRPTVMGRQEFGRGGRSALPVGRVMAYRSGALLGTRAWLAFARSSRRGTPPTGGCLNPMGQEISPASDPGSPGPATRPATRRPAASGPRRPVAGRDRGRRPPGTSP
jgi:hypothetical protein